ncbi:MAG: response regulator [Phycisphaerae bacterium]|nr:response regulator [Phycisphaerae bacterium]
MSGNPPFNVEALDVLVIDDDADHRWLTRDALCQMDRPCRIHEAAGAEEAMAMLLRADAEKRWVNPDVIFLDIEMPGMDGLALLEQIRAQPELKDIQVVFVTGIELTKEQREAIRRGGAQSLVFKTRNILEMARALRRPLEAFSPTGRAKWKTT